MEACKTILIILSAIMMMVSSGFAATKVDQVEDYNYVINLATSAQKIQMPKMTATDLKQYKLYVIRQRAGAKIEYNLRMGFFKTHSDAQAVMETIEYDYLNVRIDTLKTEEYPFVEQWLKKQFPQLAIASKQIAGELVPVKALMLLANQSMQEKRYTKAIGIYTKIINAPTNEYQQQALENLGLARESNRQLAHAKAEYQLYLEAYPSTEGAVRVKQRLDALLAQRLPTAFVKRTQQLRMTEEKWQHYGNLYQFYYRDDVDNDDIGSITANSSLSTNINYTARNNNKKSPMEANVAATHVYDTEDSEANKERLTSLYFYMSSRDGVFDMRFGRQKHKTISIFNRYDGADLGYRVSPGYKAKLVFGYPVEFNETVDDRQDKHFYSMGLELMPEASSWKTNLFYLEQQADDIQDRQEIAVDTGYQNKQQAFYTLLDYSIQYETVNFYLITLNQRYQSGSSLSVMADYRKTPFLTTTNALQGQVGVSSLSDLLSTLTEDEIEQLSLDRTAVYKSITANYAHYVDDALRVTADVTVSNMSGTIASAGVEALQDTGNEYSYSVGLVANNVFTSNDSNMVNMRSSQLSTSDVLLVSFSSKLRVNRSWRINPRLRYDTRDYDDGRSSTAIRPSVSIKNKMSKHWQFEMELSYEDKEVKNPVTTDSNEKNQRLYAGYVYTF